MSDDVKEPEAVTRARQHVAAIDEADRLGIDHADAPDYQQFLRDILGHIDALTEYALAAEREREAMLGTIYNVEAMAAEIATLREQVADYQRTEGAWEAACVQAERERDAEIARLRGLVRDAYAEGWHYRFAEGAGAYHVTMVGHKEVVASEIDAWDESDTRKALDGAP